MAPNRDEEKNQGDAEKVSLNRTTFMSCLMTSFQLFGGIVGSN